MARSTPDDSRLRVLRPWRATYTPALAVKAGQRITPGRVDDEYPGWQWVVDATGLGGWIPAAIIAGDQVTTPFDTAELSVAPGDSLLPLARHLGWTRCQSQDGQTGWVPNHCLSAD